MRKSLERNLYNGSETWREDSLKNYHSKTCTTSETWQEDSLKNDNSKYLKRLRKRNKFQFQFFFKEQKMRHFANGVPIWNSFASPFRLNQLDTAFVNKNIFKFIQLTFLAEK